MKSTFIAWEAADSGADEEERERRHATILPPVLAPKPLVADVARLASQKCDEHGELVEEALHGTELRGSFEMRLSRARARLAASLDELADALPEDDHARRALWLHRSRLAMLGIVVADPWAMELLAMANDAEPRSTLPAPAPTEEM